MSEVIDWQAVAKAEQRDNERLKCRIKELESQVDIPRGSGYLAAQMADCLGLNEIPTVMGPLLHAAASLSDRAIKADELEKRIEYAMKTSNGRWEEWGVRAEAVCLILEGRDPYDESPEVEL